MRKRRFTAFPAPINLLICDGTSALPPRAHKFGRTDSIDEERDLSGEIEDEICGYRNPFCPATSGRRGPRPSVHSTRGTANARVLTPIVKLAYSAFAWPDALRGRKQSNSKEGG